MNSAAKQLDTDRAYLASSSYRDSTNLLTRANLYQYQLPHVDLIGWSLDQIPWRGDERVVDVGCGPGRYLRRLADRPGLHLVGMDISSGMLRDLRRDWNSGRDEGNVPPLPHLAVADVQEVPLPDASCDVALAMHMLYHVPDIPRAAHELRRVLRPDGVLLAVTNREDHLQELFEAAAAAVATVGGVSASYHGIARSRFRLDDSAPLLQVAFDAVERREVLGTLYIPTVEPVLAYVESTRSITEPQLPSGVTWAVMLAELERIVTTTIAEQGVFKVRTAAGMFICR